MTKDPRVYLAHILERANRIEEYIRDAIAAILPPLEQLERDLAGDDPNGAV